MTTILSLLVVLGLLIFVHELGHFLVARANGIAVEIFSLGFGPRLWGWKWGSTDYRISLLPLGGYVKMLGEEDGEKETNDPHAFSSQSVSARAAVIIAGPLMNILLALFLMPAVFMIGRHMPVYLDQPPTIEKIRPHSPAFDARLQAGDLVQSVDGQAVATWADVIDTLSLSSRREVQLTIARAGKTLQQSISIAEKDERGRGFVGIEPFLFLGNEAIVGQLRPRGPAEAAGITPGDRVLAIDGVPVIDWLDLADQVNRSAGKSIRLQLARAGQRIALTLQPTFDAASGRWLIGIQKDEQAAAIPMKLSRSSFGPAVTNGAQEVGRLIVMTLQVVKKLVTFHLSYKVLGGPIVIAKTTAAAAASGLSDLLYFVAFISVQLAILNVLPIPVLDGGQIFFLVIEGIRRRPVPLRIRQIATQIGFACLLLLMLVVTWNDIERTWGVGRWLKKWIP